MSPVGKFNSIIVTVTTMVMYSLWICITQIDEKNIQKYGVLIVIITALSSLGFYRLANDFLKLLFKNNKFIKKFILGDKYLEGTWVGVYVGINGEIRYIFETYEQNLEGVLISGYSYKENKNIHGKWKAQNPIIDSNNKKLIYYYETDMIANTHINQGFASFTLEKDANSKFYNKMQGFSSDLYCCNKIYAIEEKISEECWTDRDKILQKAKEIYEKNRELLP